MNTEHEGSRLLLFPTSLPFYVITLASTPLNHLIKEKCVGVNPLRRGKKALGGLLE